MEGEIILIGSAIPLEGPIDAIAPDALMTYTAVMAFEDDTGEMSEIRAHSSRSSPCVAVMKPPTDRATSHRTAVDDVHTMPMKRPARRK
jgi:hypothetical protein